MYVHEGIRFHKKPVSFIIFEMTLKDFFKENPKAALAFSGGVDSSYLMLAAAQAGADVKAYLVKGPFQPQFELEDAYKVAEQTGIEMKVLQADVLSDEQIASNPPNRCYYCKKKVFGLIMAAAAEDGYQVIMDGTNASDDAGDRPGMKALAEMQVRSPLRECGLTKADVRRLSREGGLFTWNKPAYACLATRIPSGDPITEEKLEATEHCEGFMFSLGFSDFRIRRLGDNAKLQLPEDQLQLLMHNRKSVIEELGKYYKDVLLDLNTR